MKTAILLLFTISMMLFCQVPGQTPVAIFGASTALPNSPASDPTMQLWISADCMTAISPCSTSYSNNHTLTTGEGWKDRSGNGHDITADVNFLNCQYQTNQFNGNPAVDFPATGCSFTTSGFDSGNTKWTIFAAYKSHDTATLGIFNGGKTLINAAPNNFALETNNGAGAQYSVENGTAGIGQGTTAKDTNFHVYMVTYIQSGAWSDTLDGAADGSGTSMVTISGQIAFIGASERFSAYDTFLYGQLAELIYYTGTTALTADQITQTTNYLRHKYGQI